MLDTDLGQTYTYIKCSLFQKRLRLDVRIILCLMSSGVFVHTFALAFRKMSSAIAKAGPSKEAAPVLETPEKDRHKEEVRGDDGGDLCWEEQLELKRLAKFALN